MPLCSLILRQKNQIDPRTSVGEVSLMYFYFSSLSPFLSYTTGSRVKQAALQKVCSSLTPRLQTHSSQDEEKERERERKGWSERLPNAEERGDGGGLLRSPEMDYITSCMLVQ